MDLDSAVGSMAIMCGHVSVVIGTIRLPQQVAGIWRESIYIVQSCHALNACFERAIMKASVINYSLSQSTGVTRCNTELTT